MNGNGEMRFTPGRHFADMKALVGTDLGVSGWIEVDQTMIDLFAECTGDRQWIHVDAERARRESPYGAPVAHGYLTLSLIPVMAYEIGAAPEGVKASINYGLDRVRFLTPVKVGSRVRLHSHLLSFEQRSPGQYLMKQRQTIDIEGSDQPALIAETLSLLVAG
ncbi:MAG: MaoC family dehydratase [Rhizobiaceae bacterium]|jgi:acyl dehydratase